VGLNSILAGGAGVRPKLAHIIPNFQNPAGYTLSLAKRERLLELSREYGFVVFEDDPYVELRFSGDTLPTMLSLDPERVVYASSFSKTVAPGIRVGYLVGPREVVAKVEKLATGAYISPNMVAQGIVNQFVRSGAIERSIETVKNALQERVTTLSQALRRELPDARFQTPEGGYFMWVEFPRGTDVNALFAAAGDPELALCVMPGAELAFTGEVACLPTGLLGWRTKIINHQTAIFRQVNKDKLAAHHDALEFPDGRIVLLTLLCEGQAATVLQLPAQPSTAAEANAQKRVTYVG